MQKFSAFDDDPSRPLRGPSADAMRGNWTYHEPTKHPVIQHFSTMPQTLPTPPPNRHTLPNLPQIDFSTYDYIDDTPKAFWHIGTSGAILILAALRAPQIPAATARFALESRAVVAGVDNLAAFAVEHELLQRHRPPS
jgi:hypothetical protein